MGFSSAGIAGMAWLWGPSKPLVHPVLGLVVDLFIFVHVVLTFTFSQVEGARWSRGEIDDGLNGRKKVQLSLCPIFNPATGLPEYILYQSVGAGGGIAKERRRAAWGTIM